MSYKEKQFRRKVYRATHIFHPTGMLEPGAVFKMGGSEYVVIDKRTRNKGSNAGIRRLTPELKGHLEQV